MTRQSPYRQSRSVKFPRLHAVALGIAGCGFIWMLSVGSPASAADKVSVDEPPLSIGLEGRISVKTRFKKYLDLLNAGDELAAAYVSPQLEIEAPDAQHLAAMLRDPQRARIRLIPSDILLDDSGGTLSALVEFLPRDGSKNNAPISRTAFFTLDAGRIVSIHIAREGSQYIPGNGASVTRPIIRKEALPASAFQPFMTRGKFEDYLRLFGAFDERYVLYYHPEIIFGIKPAAQPLYGREEILQLYRPLRKALDESVVINAIVIDSERGAMAVEISNTMTATAPVKLPTLTMQAGDRRIASGVVFYELKDGLIIEVR